MNKKGFSFLYILIAIFIILLIALVLILGFKDDIFKKKQKEIPKTYSDILLTLHDIYTNESVNATVFVQNTKTKEEIKLLLKENVYESLNSSLSEYYIDSRKDCVPDKFLFFKYTACKTTKIEPPIEYGEYCFIITGSNIYTQTTCKNFTASDRDQYGHIPFLIEVTKIADSRLLSNGFLEEGDGTTTKEITIFMSTSNGELRNPIFCMNITVGVMNANLEGANLILNTNDIPLKGFRCYNLFTNLNNLNNNYNFKIYYKPSKLFKYDEISLAVYQNNNIYNNKEFTNNYIKVAEMNITKNGAF
jgi:hypothetical protein